MSLANIFGLYTICFLGVTILIGIAEHLFGLSPQWIGWIFMALSLGIYVVIGIITRTSNPDQYYVAGRGVPAIYNGMATGSDWMSAASFISMAGALSAQGFAGLAYVMGWTGGYLVAGGFLGSLPSAIRCLHDSRFSRRALRRQPAAHHRCSCRDRLLVHLSYRAGHRCRSDCIAASSASISISGSSSAWWAFCFVRCWAG